MQESCSARSYDCSKNEPSYLTMSAMAVIASQEPDETPELGVKQERFTSIMEFNLRAPVKLTGLGKRSRRSLMRANYLWEDCKLSCGTDEEFNKESHAMSAKQKY